MKTCFNCRRLVQDAECREHIWCCKSCLEKEVFVCECGYFTRRKDAYDGLCGYCYNNALEEYCRGGGAPIRGYRFDFIKSTRAYGVEIETDTGNYGKVPDEWGIKLDGSIFGLELVSPLMQGDDGLESIRELYEEVEPSFTQECGIHVHVDVRDLSEVQLLDLVRAFENTKKTWMDKVPEHRVKNVYCRKENLYPSCMTWKQWYLKNGKDRFHWVNFQAVEDHGSVEIRILEGAGVEKVVHWVATVVNFVEQVVNMERKMPTHV